MLKKEYELTFNFLDVGGGDAIWIRFLGNDAKWHNVLVDGGYGIRYRYAFQPLIHEIIKEECIDLWIITHTDLDHIGAVLGFIADKQLRNKTEVVKQFWFNYSPIKLQEQGGKLGVGHGITLRNFLEEHGLLIQEALTTDHAPIDFYGLKFTFLSPSQDRLSTANELWTEREKSAKTGRTAAQSDHRITIEQLSAKPFQEDTDPWNGAAIASLVEFKQTRAVLLADSHPTTILEALGASPWKDRLPLKVDFLQLSHHGSKANNSPAMLDAFDTTKYVVTGNGIFNRHPDKEALVRAITKGNRTGDQLDFLFPVKTDELEDMFSVDETPFVRYNFKMVYPDEDMAKTILQFLPIKH